MTETLDNLAFIEKVKNRFNKAYRERTEKHFAEIIEQEKLQAPVPSAIDELVKKVDVIYRFFDEEKAPSSPSKLTKKEKFEIELQERKDKIKVNSLLRLKKKF